MNITAIHLSGFGNHMEVCIEYEGKWYKVIEEQMDGAPVSWITEEAGMKQSIKKNRRPSYESRRS